MADFGETGKICEKNFVSFIKLRISSLTGAQSEFLKITPTAVPGRGEYCVKLH